MSADRIGGARVATQELGGVEAEAPAAGGAVEAAPEGASQAARTQRPASVGIGVAALMDRLQQAEQAAATAGAPPGTAPAAQGGAPAATQGAPPSAPAPGTAPAQSTPAQSTPAGPSAPAPSVPSPAAAHATQRRGASGPEVESLQRDLNAWRAQQGLPPIKVDGLFGPETEGAVKAFQTAKGLAADGAAGPLTWGALGGGSTAPAPSPGPSPTPGPTPSTPGAPSNRPAPGPAPAPTPGPTPPTPGPRPAPPTPSGPSTSHAAGSPYPHGAQSVKQEAVWTRLHMPGKISVSEMPSNGNRPVGVYVPPGLDPSKPVNVVTLFHGHNSSIGEGFERNGLLPNKINELAAQHPNTVFVFPQAADHPFNYWMKPPKESMAALEQQALGEAARMAGVPSLTVGQRTVSAHSGGGLALRNAVAAGEMRADSIEMLDCTYGDWGQQVARWAMQKPEGQRPRIESWHTSGDTEVHDREIARIAPGIFQAHQSPVAHSSIPSRFLGSTLR